jgi:hypothetical protein
MAVQHILIIFAHQLLRPGLQIGVLGVGHAFHDATLIALAPLRIGRVKADRRNGARDGPEIDAALQLPTELRRCEIGRRVLLCARRCS